MLAKTQMQVQKSGKRNAVTKVMMVVTDEELRFSLWWTLLYAPKFMQTRALLSMPIRNAEKRMCSIMSDSMDSKKYRNDSKLQKE